MKKQKKKNRGFTLVEVLICVGIIGIIAAITIPALISSTSVKALEAQRKALHSRMAQAFGQIKNLQTFGTDETNSALEFISSGLSTVYKLTAICTADDLEECGIPDNINDQYSDTLPPKTTSLYSKKTLVSLNSSFTSADDWGGLNTNVVGFKTANGESVLLYYNPKCKSKTEANHNITRSVCINMIYDLNGKHGTPNSYGEDIGYITVFYPSDPVVVAPVLYNKEAFSGTYSDMLSKSTSLELMAPSVEELVSILINKDLTQITSSGSNTANLHWSSTYSSSDTSKVWAAGLSDGATLDNISLSGSATSHPYYLIKK